MTLPRSVSRALPRYGPPRPLGLRRRPWWHRAWGLCAVLLGAAAMVWAAGFWAALPGKVAQERAFASAVPCTAAGAGAAPADCLHTVPATVTRTVIRSAGRSETYRLELAGPAPASGSVEMYSAGPLLKRLRPGDQVGVTVWRRYATAVSRGGRTQRTEDNPEGDQDITTAAALGALVCGAYLLGAGGYGLLGARRAAEHGLPAVLVPLGRIAAVAALAAWPACLLGVVRGGAVVVVLAWLVMLPVIGWIVVARGRRVARRAALGRSAVLRRWT